MTDAPGIQQTSRERKLAQLAKDLREAKIHLRCLAQSIEDSLRGAQLSVARRYLATAFGGVAAVIHDIEKEQGE